MRDNHKQGVAGQSAKQSPYLRSWRSSRSYRAYLSKSHVCLLGLSIAVLISSPAQSDLTQVPNLTPLQLRTAEAMQAVCPPLAIARQQAPLPSEQERLFLRCDELIETARELQGLPPITDRSLGLTNEELAAALRQMAHEEAAAPGTLATETIDAQFTNLGARLATLRTGAMGLSISSLNLNLDKQTWQASTSGLIPPSGERGDAAGGNMLTDWDRLGVFINGTVGFGDRDQTDREAGFDFDTSGITLGADYRLTDNLVLGAALGYANLDADFDVTTTVAGGGAEVDGYSVSVYGLYYLDNFYLDGIASYGWNDYTIRRRIVYFDRTGRFDLVDGVPVPRGANRTATADPKGDQFSIGVGAGYELQVGSWTYGPYARVNYFDLEIDGYREHGAGWGDFQIDNQKVESFTSVVGGRVAYAISRDFGVLVPQGWLEWHYEFKDDSRSIEARFVQELVTPGVPGAILRAETEPLDRNYFTLGLGVSGVFRRGMQAFFNYETALGLRHTENHVFIGGVRFEF